MSLVVPPRRSISPCRFRRGSIYQLKSKSAKFENSAHLKLESINIKGASLSGTQIDKLLSLKEASTDFNTKAGLDEVIRTWASSMELMGLCRKAISSKDTKPRAQISEICHISRRWVPFWEFAWWDAQRNTNKLCSRLARSAATTRRPAATATASQASGPSQYRNSNAVLERGQVPPKWRNY